MLAKGTKLRPEKPNGNGDGESLETPEEVKAAIAGFAKSTAEPDEKQKLALRIIRAAKRFNLALDPGSMIGKLAGMKAG